MTRSKLIIVGLINNVTLAYYGHQPGAKRQLKLSPKFVN